MKIISLEVKGYNRFKLSSKLYWFKYKPTKKIQLIIGKNGIGKTSFLKLLLITPVSHKDLDKDGYIITKVEHNDKIYKISTDNRQSKKYSFIIDGSEINPTGKVTIQKQLIEEHFRLNNRIISILTDETSFTRLSAQERRKWITELSETDYDYVMGVYTKLIEKQRFLANIIKYNMQRTVAEENNIDSDYTQVEKDIEDINKSIAYLIDKKQIYDKEITLDDVKGLDQHIRTSLQEAFKLGPLVSKYFYNNNINIPLTDVINNLSITRSEKINAIEHLKESILELNTEISDVSTDIPDEISDNKHDLLKLKDSIKKEIVKIKVDSHIDATDVDNKLSRLITLEDNIRDIIVHLHENSNRYYSKATYDKINNKLASLKEDRAVLKDRLDILHIRNKEFEYILNNDKEECPSCGYEYYKDYDKNLHDHIKEDIVKIQEKLDNIDKSISDKESEIDEINTYFRYVKSLLDITNNNDILSDLWEDIIDSSLYIDNPVMVMSVIKDYKDSYIKLSKIHKLQDQLNQIDDKIKILESIDDSKLAIVKKEIAKKQKKLESIMCTKDIYESDIETIDNNLKYLIKYKDIVDSLNSLIQSKENKIKDYSIKVKQTHIDKSLSIYHQELNRLNISLSRAKVAQKLLDKYKDQLDESISEKKIIDELIKELSPNKGLIATSLLGFITTMLNNVNKIIADMWTYPLIIKPPEFNEDGTISDLNYKFKVDVGDNIITDDISNTSDGQEDIIDLGFKLVIMDYLNLGGYPLLLDELARKFDEEHRLLAYNYIDKTIINMGFSMVAIVSHYKDLFSIFSDNVAEFTVLDDDNIDTSVISNPNTAITFY